MNTARFAFIDFGHLVNSSGGSQSKVRVIRDRNLIFAIELAAVFTGKTINDAGLCLRRLHSNNRFPNSKYVQQHLHIRGNTDTTKLLTLENALQLIMILPGPLADSARESFAVHLTRCVAQDVQMRSAIPGLGRVADAAVATLNGSSVLSD